MTLSFLRKLSCVFLFAMACAVVFPSVGSAQDLDYAVISGKITDSTGGAVVGATVTTKLATTGVERTVVTNEDGFYQVLKLEPGTYTVKFSANGFSVKEQTNVATIAGQNVQLNITLLPAGVTAEQTVVITDEPPAVDTTRTVVGGTVTEREVEELPNNTRNPLDLIFTLGGVTEEPLSTRDLANDRGQRGLSEPGSTPEEAGVFGLSGGAAYSNNITVDGLDNNDDRTASFRFQPSIESISEVQVITNQFSAEYGRASGGRVNLRTRGGSNKFRGRVFYFFRDARLNANTWNNNRRGIARPKFTDHDPGFTFGGPIVKNKLFFFTAYEYDNIKEDTILDAYVPVTNTNTQFPLPAPTNASSPIAVTSSGNTVFVAPYIAPFDTPAKKHIFQARIDWNASNKHNFTFNYQLGRSNDLRAFSGTNRIADSIVGRVRNTDAFNATHNYVISSKAVNQLRFQYSRLRPYSAQNVGALSPAILVTFTPPSASSTTQVFGSTSNSNDRTEDRWQLQDTFNYVAGKHSLRFGADVQRVDSIFTDRFDTTGTYSYSNFYFFSINSVSTFTQNFNTESAVKNTYYGIFFQDDWRARSNLTINYGLRYEAETVVDDDNNFGPRFSVAWNPFPKGNKTVVRAGAGIFYNRALLRTIDDFTSGSQELRFSTTTATLQNRVNSIVGNTSVTVDANTVRNFINAQVPNPLALDTLVPVNSTRSFTVQQLSQSGASFRSISPDLQLPESYQFNAGFERELYKGLVFETNFTYNKTVRLWREFNPNAPVLPSGTPDRDGDGQITFTDYLLGVSTSTTRFELGSATDTTGLRRVSDGGTCTNITTNCIVNLRTTNVSTAACNLPPFTTGNNPTNTPRCRAFDVIRQLQAGAAIGDYEQREQVASIGNSLYKGITFELRNRYRKFGHGFAGSMRFVYTLSSLKDDGIVNTSEATLPGDFDREYSRSLLDRRHRIAFSGTFDTPVWMGKLRFSPIFRYGSSSPFNISIGGRDRNLDDISNDRPNFTGSLSDIVSRDYGSPYPTDLANRFSLAPIGSPGNLPRNAGRGPSQYILDLNITREFRLGERMRLRPSIEIDNVFNWTVFSFGSNFINFDLLNSTNAATVAEAQAGFLAPTRTLRPRQIRLGVRFDF